MSAPRPAAQAARLEARLDAALPWWRGLDEARQAALIEIAFELGIGRLMALSCALTCLRRREFEAAAGLVLASEWGVRAGARARRLAQRIKDGAGADAAA